MSEKAQLGAAIGKIPSCLAIITCKTESMLGSWIQQASFDPPLVTIAVKTGRPILDLIRTSKGFAVSLLGEDSNLLVGLFAKGDAEALTKVKHTPSPAGHPVLRDAVAWLDCALRQDVATGDHVLCVGEVTAAVVQREDAKPRVHLRKNGFNY